MELPQRVLRVGTEPTPTRSCGCDLAIVPLPGQTVYDRHGQEQREREDRNGIFQSCLLFFGEPPFGSVPTAREKEAHNHDASLSAGAWGSYACSCRFNAARPTRLRRRNPRRRLGREVGGL